MAKRILSLTRDPFSVEVGANGEWYFVDPSTGDILYGSAVFHNEHGWRFVLATEHTRRLLKLHSLECTFDIGWTDAPDAASWVDAVNRFLETKRGVAATNGKAAPLSPVENPVG